MLAIRLPPDIEVRLEKLAAATGRTKSFYAREAILEHIADLEDVYLAEQRLADLREGRSTAIPMEDVMKKYGLADQIRSVSREGTIEAGSRTRRANSAVSFRSRR